jgi:hypothetical protein
MFSVFREEDEVARKVATLEEALEAIRDDAVTMLATGSEAGPYMIERREPASPAWGL